MVEREIDKRKTQEQELIFNARMVELGEMIGAITHQWMQPLNALSISMQDFEDIFQHGEMDDEYVKDFLERSYNQINFMSKTIKDFRNFYKKDSEKMELFSVETVIGEVLALINGILNKKSIQIFFEYDPENTHFAYGHPNEFRHVILNILNNSKDAILQHQDDLGYIKLNVNQHNEFIEIAIADNGGGVPEEIKANIFKPYFTTKGQTGTGIGLSLAKTIIEEHFNGKIILENAGEGARFSIYLPKPKH